jgi:hypothetical protein
VVLWDEAEMARSRPQAYSAQRTARANERGPPRIRVLYFGGLGQG